MKRPCTHGLLQILLSTTSRRSDALRVYVTEKGSRGPGRLPEESHHPRDLSRSDPSPTKDPDGGSPNV